MLLFIGAATHAQNADTLIARGIEYHDRGEFKSAEKLYKQAIELAPEKALAWYELALTYYHWGKMKKAERAINKAVALEDLDICADVFALQGSLYDDMGYAYKAIWAYQEGIAECGPSYSLYYNMGLAQWKMGDVDAAGESFNESAQLNPFTPSSHILLWAVYSSSGQKVRSALPGLFSFIFETETNRSEMVFENLSGILYPVYDEDGNIELDMKTFSLGTQGAEGLTGKDFEWSLKVAKLAGDAKDSLDEIETFHFITSAYIDYVHELRPEDPGTDAVWLLYEPAFYEMKELGLLSTYCYMVYAPYNEEASTWVEEHAEEVDALVAFVEELEI